MPALAVAAEEEHLVLCLVGGLLVQLVDVVVEALPLRESGVFVVRIVGAVDQAEVVCCLCYRNLQFKLTFG
jgi:hypothetical protein